MIAFRIFDATSGLLIGVGRASSLDDLFVREGHVVVGADTSIPAENTRLNVETMVEEYHERVTVPLPSGGPAPCDLELEAYTPGTVMDITLNTGRVSFTAPGDGTRLEIGTPGSYPVRISPPFPELPISGVVEVTDA